MLDVDVESMTARQVFYACHGRAPGSGHEALAHETFTGQELMLAAMSSREFQESFVARFLAAFPEKTRMFFVHIPKCAGSDLSTHLIGRYASINTKSIDPDVTGTFELFDSIRDAALEIAVCDTIYVHGHTHLQTYAKWGGLRHDDEVFTTLRNPLERIQSQVNYVLTRIFSNEDPIKPDTAGWRALFKVTDQTIQKDPVAIQALARRILAESGVVPRNVMCQYLGAGTSESAIDRLAVHNVEVTDLQHYHSWIKEKWNISRHTRMNESKKFLALKDLPGEDLDYIREIIQEDEKLITHIQGRLLKLGTNSVKGIDIIKA